MPAASLILVIFIILVALAFDFINGMHDAANSIAAVVSTRVLSRRQAVVWAAFFNFIAFLIFGTAVAKTIGAGMINPAAVTPFVVLSGLLGAISWSVLIRLLRLPTSSSHALMGAYAGAAVGKAGFGVIIAQGWVKTIIFIFLAPILGAILGLIFIWIAIWVVHKKHPGHVNQWFRKLQLLSACAYSLGHGGNDAQKTMGIIASLLFSAGYMKTFHIPLWIVLSAHAAIALGTLSGGWWIAKTIRQRIVKLQPLDGFCAETASSMSIFLATYIGVPISTTHVITGAVSGVGTIKRLSAVRWGVTLRIVWAWIFTIPGAALLGCFFYFIFRAFSSILA